LYQLWDRGGQYGQESQESEEGKEEDWQEEKEVAFAASTFAETHQDACATLPSRADIAAA
jgi:hypothetical protein